MNIKSLIIVGVLFVATSLLQSCSCPESITKAESPSGRYAAEVSLEGKCGGATVGYYTELAIHDKDEFSILPRWNTIWQVRGDVPAQTSWRSANRLELRHAPLATPGAQVIFQTDRFRDIEVSYVSDPSLQRK